MIGCGFQFALSPFSHVQTLISKVMGELAIPSSASDYNKPSSPAPLNL